MANTAGVKRRRVTASMVAERAGVSVATVSYVLNDAPNQTITPATRERVLEAVRELDYAPSSAARALRLGRNDVVLLVLPDWPPSLAVAQLSDALATELAGQGLRLVTEREGAGPSRTWRTLSPAAVLKFGDLDEEDKAAMKAAGIMAIDRLVITRNPTAVPHFSQQAIGAAQVKHLYDRGHRNIAYAAATGAAFQPFSDLRKAGATEACTELGIDDVAEWHMEDAGAEPGAWFTKALKERGPITAVAAFNDEVAAALLATARTNGVEVPASLAVIGVDDQPMSRFTDPPLSSVRQNSERMAGHLAEMIRASLARKPLPEPPGAGVLDVVTRRST
ncbi:LacI family DNA-binding transcriptional regulator [Arthrobacter sp. W4I7]|uniref:LacI family DNA-binding transcriptional regulator n=1 Tax=Arthrobacter sp. W4I7 TaxID=3042296 RepID=UPI00277E7C67|nr:LacI family DNA-binding transcriptional regulator [Arthrobacter sp. W4I7]MDQ0689086.1 DNA-binding LacI/PurR family transcriptional regulator [Arthrobacter sp. W4I7]